MKELMVFTPAVGLFFGVPLLALIFLRLEVKPPKPNALTPTLLIVVSPFAAGYLVLLFPTAWPICLRKHLTC
jgi:tellurite resistance protein